MNLAIAKAASSYPPRSRHPRHPPHRRWSLGGECLPLREIGEAEIFEYCGPGLGPELELLFIFYFFYLFFFWAAGNHVAMAMAMAMAKAGA